MAAQNKRLRSDLTGDRMAHFAAAIFGDPLQGREDLKWYFSEDFIAQHDELAWGAFRDGEGENSMSREQQAAIIGPVFLVGSMIIFFRLLSSILGPTLGWLFGLVFYWLVWCAGFTLWLIGKDSLYKIIRPQRLTWQILLLLAIPIIGSLAYKLIPGMDYGQTSRWLTLMMITTALGNGFFEEVLWRGAYMELFSENLFFRILWPSTWFALWHFAPGSVSPDGNVIALMIGSGVFGLYLSFLAWKTGTIWWSIVAHVTGGLIMAV